MRKYLYALAAAAVVAVAALPAAAVGAADRGERNGHDKNGGPHNLSSPLAKKQNAAKEKAIQMKLEGKIAADAKVAKVGGPKGQFVELANEGSDRVFVIIAEFGNTRHVSFPDSSPVSTATVFDGPLHNAIPAPDRNVDNSTLWQADYAKAHYENMYFNRMKKFYEDQSSGRYSINGDVTEWVKVPFNEARYGRSGDFGNVDPAVCASNVCNNTWFLIRDAMAFWVQERLTAGDTMAEIQTYLKTFDVADRYDIDGDGNFNEPDKVIDHFQIVHSGGDEAAGDPYQGTDAIWSHRWAAQITLAGSPLGVPATQIGQGGPSSGQTIPHNPTGVWVYDYTIQPENGGLGVFAHEYAHDLGLPDNYDTSGNVGGAENSTGFWDLMSSGANIGDGGDEGIGDAPTNLTAWDKLQLGWLNYEFVPSVTGTTSHKLTPLGATTKQAQAVIVGLPQSMNPNVLDLGGTQAFWSGMGDGLDNTMTRDVTLPAAPVTVNFKAWYEIETCWDYAYLRVSTDGGTSYTNVQTSISDAGNEHGQNFGHGITGISGQPKECDEASGTPSWVNATADLSAFAGQTVKLQFRYWTDPFVQGRGFVVDDVAVNGAVIGTGADNEGWTFNGFNPTTGGQTTFHNHYYMAEYRPYRDYDTSLASAYNFGFATTMPDWVEHYRYQDGVLLWYWDTGEADNGVGDHPGEGQILPIDIRPTFAHSYDGHLLRARTLTYDSALTVDPIESITVHKDGNPTTIPGGPAQPLFNDLNDYWFNSDGDGATGSHVGRHQPGWIGVKVPKTGTTIELKNISGNEFFAQIQVAPAK